MGRDQYCPSYLSHGTVVIVATMAQASFPLYINTPIEEEGTFLSLVCPPRNNTGLLIELSYL